MVGLVLPRLKEWVRKAHHTHQARYYWTTIGLRNVAKVTCRVLLERIHEEVAHIDVCVAIGQRLGLVYQSRKQKDPDAWTRRLGRLADVMGWKQASWTKQKSEHSWTRSTQVRFGLLLSKLVEEWTGLIQIVPDPRKKAYDKTRINIVRGDDELLRWMREKQEVYQHEDEWRAPRGELPPTWSKEVKGLVRRDKGFTGEVDMPMVYDALNWQQGTRWRINRRVLAVLEEVFDSGMAVGGVPGGNRPQLEKRVDKREWARHQNNLYQWERKRKLAGRVLACAAGLPETFHFKWSCDFRGRAYPHGTTISPQGPDIGRAMLEFADGEKLVVGTLTQLTYHGANMWGVRGSYAVRKNWVVCNHDEILKSARQPLDERWWSRAKEPWRFLAFCFEWAEAHRIRDHVTHLPCQIDGTCSGFQIAALAARDRELAVKVNCTNTLEMQDLYMEVAEHVQRQCLDNRWGVEWIELLEGVIPRDMVKPAVIAAGFGSSMWGVRKAVEEWFWRQPFHRPFGGQVSGPCEFIAEAVTEALQFHAQSFGKLNDWSNSIAELKEDKGEDVGWISPSGFPVVCRYRRQRRVVFRVENNKVSEIEETTIGNRQKSVRTLIPNLIHSLDGAAMVKTINRCDFDVASVHDCCMALATRMESLHQAVRAAYSTMFAGDVLGDFAGQMGLDPVPVFDTGDFNPNELTDSRYFYT